MNTAREVFHSLIWRDCNPVVVIAIAVAMASVAHGLTHVTPSGSFGPAPEDVANPYGSVKAATLNTPDGGVISLAAGTYPEILTLDRPLIYTVAPGATAVIGDTSGVILSTTLKVWTQNMHAFGDTPFTPDDFFDAVRVATARLHFESVGFDFIALQELWDDDFWNSTFRDGGYGFPFSRFGGNSGLLEASSGVGIVSRVGMSNPFPERDDQEKYFTEFADCGDTDGDCFAEKGFTGGVFVKDGLKFGIWGTHFDSGYETEDFDARRVGMAQIVADMAIFRASNPDAVVLLMGDLNIIGDRLAPNLDTGELVPEYNQMATQLGLGAGFRDGARNSVGARFVNADHWTHRRNNDLAGCLLGANCLACDDFTEWDWECNGFDARLDYILYIPSLDGKTIVVPKRVSPSYELKWTFPGRLVDMSDHDGVVGEFTVQRMR